MDAGWRRAVLLMVREGAAGFGALDRDRRAQALVLIAAQHQYSAARRWMHRVAAPAEAGPLQYFVRPHCGSKGKQMHWTEAEELAARVLGVDPEKSNSSEIEEKLADRFGVGLDTFQQIADALMPFTPAASSAVTRMAYHGYVHDGAFICKQAAE